MLLYVRIQLLNSCASVLIKIFVTMIQEPVKSSRQVHSAKLYSRILPVRLDLGEYANPATKKDFIIKSDEGGSDEAASSLGLFRLLHFVKHNPTRSGLASKQDRIRMHVQSLSHCISVLDSQLC